jgi:hypothetical protein
MEEKEYEVEVTYGITIAKTVTATSEEAAGMRVQAEHISHYGHLWAKVLDGHTKLIEVKVLPKP